MPRIPKRMVTGPGIKRENTVVA